MQLCRKKVHVLIWGGPTFGVCLTSIRSFSSEALEDQALALWTPSTKESEPMETDSAYSGNRVGDQTEVSRGNSSQTLIVMGETRRRRKAAPPEHNE